MAADSERTGREDVNAEFESEVTRFRALRASREKIRRLAMLEIALLAAGFAVGAFIASRIDFVPNDAKTITYLFLAALVFSAWWQWYSLRTRSNAADPVIEVSYGLTALCVAVLAAATLWIAADISSRSMHFALAVDIGAGAWFATTVLLMTPGRSLRDSLLDAATDRTYLLVLLLIVVLILVASFYGLLLIDRFGDEQTTVEGFGFR